MSSIVGWVLSLIGLASPLVVFGLLDKHLKSDLKERLSIYVLGTPEQSISDRVALFHRFLTSALGTGVVKRFIRLLMIGVVSIAFTYSLQYLFRRAEFDTSTFLFLKGVVQLKAFPIYVLLSFLFIDAVSFYQTLTFARLAANCKNPVEVLFLAFADIVVSFFLVIVILPLLILTSHKLATGPHEASFRLAIDDTPHEQRITFGEALLLAAPKLDKVNENILKDELSEKIKNNSNGWSYGVPTMFVAEPNADISLERVANGKLRQAGSTIIFEKGTLTPEESATGLKEIIAANKSVTEIKVLESDRGFFGRSIYTFHVSGISAYSGLNVFQDYQFIMSNVNFFGNDFNKAMEFGTKTYTENELTWTGLVNNIIEKSEGNVTYKCDHHPVVTVDRSVFFNLSSDTCSNGIAMSNSGVAGIGALLSYKFADETIIPILPTALSSIFLTMLIYLSIILWILLPFVRDLIEKYTDNGATLILNNQFKIYFVLLMALSAPFIIIFY